MKKSYGSTGLMLRINLSDRSDKFILSIRPVEPYDFFI